MSRDGGSALFHSRKENQVSLLCAARLFICPLSLFQATLNQPQLWGAIALNPF